ncbi:MAG: hypothetical protein ACPGN3_15635 [Opitutales bacterium]
MATLMVAASLQAIELDDIYFSGSLSVTASYSTEYPFYVEEADSLDLNSVEFIYNGMYQFDNGVQVGAQLYAYTLDGYSDIILDWGGVSYQWTPEFGVWVGKNKLYNGLHNHTQDLDVVRTFATLPLGLYSRTARPLGASINGIAAGGLIELGSAGSFEYRLTAGWIDDIDRDSYFTENSVNDWSTFEGWDIESVNYGAWGIWNTPIDGLRMGASVVYIPESSAESTIEFTNNLTGTSLAFAQATGAGVAQALALQGIPGLSPEQAWDIALAGTANNITDAEIHTEFAFLEYSLNDFTFTAEVKNQEGDAVFFIPGLGVTSTEEAPLIRSRAWYLKGTYQFTEKLAAGIQYSENDANYQVPDDETTGFAAAASYWLTDFLLLKAEAHFMDGTNIIGETTRGVDLSANDSWEYYVFKTTMTF